MKRLRNEAFKRYLSGFIVVMLLFFFVSMGDLSAGTCEKALKKCLIDAGAAGVLGAVAGSLIGAAIGAGVYAGWCVDGYFWCLSYYKK